MTVTPIPFAQPPQLPEVVSTWTLHSYENLSAMRAGLSVAVVGPVGPQGRRAKITLRHMLLASSELATNALKHARSSARVVLTTDGESFLVDVVDRARDTAPTRPAGRGPGEGGFGLVLVARVSSDCGWYVNNDEKHIWATFPTHDDA